MYAVKISVRNDGYLKIGMYVRLSYGKIQALKDVSLEVEEGSLFGIIGPDGAGKTSLFRIMTTLIVPDSGSAQVCGYDTVKDMMEIRRLVGYMPGHFSLYQDLTVESGELQPGRGHIPADRAVQEKTCGETLRRNEAETGPVLRHDTQAPRAFSR